MLKQIFIVPDSNAFLSPPNFPHDCDKVGEAVGKILFLPENSGWTSFCVSESWPVFEQGWVRSVGALWAKSESESPASLLARQIF